jgi:hypothetical protein
LLENSGLRDHCEFSGSAGCPGPPSKAGLGFCGFWASISPTPAANTAACAETLLPQFGHWQAFKFRANGAAYGIEKSRNIR